MNRNFNLGSMPRKRLGLDMGNLLLRRILLIDISGAAEAEVAGRAVGGVAAARIGAVAIAVAFVAKVAAASHHASTSSSWAGGVFAW